MDIIKKLSMRRKYINKLCVRKLIFECASLSREVILWKYCF